MPRLPARPFPRLLPRLLDLVLPLECAACGRPGAAWCRRCARALARCRLAPEVARVRPDPIPAGLPPSHAWGSYSGPLRAAIRAWKDGGRRDLDVGLARLLGVAIDRAARDAGWPVGGALLVVPIPSSTRADRSRGDRPLVRVVGRAVAGIGDGTMTAGGGPSGATHRLEGPLVALRHSRTVADQAGLGALARLVNLQSAMEVRGSAAHRVRGRRCLLVDDVMTTGSTLAEGARALHDAGAADVHAAVIAATPRLPPAFPQPTRRSTVIERAPVPGTASSGRP
ncbi:phosphoribosyltransferase [Intrasporangium calvum DSM 43043]|uniref:Phosphoribosyltransferase n=1 Tax=Intrasporangium calvum (strain ATCC 23552 / DSM 43043 / JCM 3097 / NBRC 12989 / NCIMB 10167 / NRRL B-3866 / 7 KIP) TaxID=710696 RepID=E6S777_INTC7|nr:phosphoribosyltransferase [Intrasporangium calvum DSM 43043]AXG13973.1 ComF family protein [Intrasporangium calvum]